MVQSYQALVTPEMSKHFNANEVVMYAERMYKLRAVGQSQQDASDQRVYVQTTDNIYTFKLTRENQWKQTRFYQIKNVGAILLSSENEHDFMLFFFNSDDLHMHSSSRDELLNLLTLRFLIFNRNKTLKIYSVSTADLIKYHINNDRAQKTRQ